MAYLYGLVAALCAVSAEALYRANVGTAWGTPGIMTLGIVLALGTNWAIWGLIQTTPLVGVSLVFSCWTAALRLGITMWQGDAVALGTWLGFIIMLIAELVRATVR